MPLQLEEIADLDLELIEDESPPPPRFNDELIAALPERDRRQLELRSELAAERGRGEKLQAETEELARQEASIERFTPTGILNQPERFMRTFGGAANAPEMPERFQAGQPVFPIEAPQGTNAMAGLGQLGVGLLNTLQTPEMIVTAPALVTPIGRALMGMEMGKEIPGQIERGAQTLGDIASTPAEQVVAVGEPVIATGMTTLISRTPSGRLTEKSKLKIARDTGQEFGEPLVFPPGRRQIEIPQEVKQTLPKAAAAAEEAVVKGQDAIQKAEAKAPVEEGAGVELRQEAPTQEVATQTEAPIKRRLVPVLVDKTGTKVLAAGMEHMEAAKTQRAKINADYAENRIEKPEFIDKLNELMEAEMEVDTQHAMLDLNTGKIVETGVGRMESKNLNRSETAANLKELQEKGIKAEAPKPTVTADITAFPDYEKWKSKRQADGYEDFSKVLFQSQKAKAKTDPLAQLRELPGTSNTSEAMALGEKVPKELLPQLEELIKQRQDEALKVLEELNAKTELTSEEFVRASDAGNLQGILAEALRAAKYGEKPATLAYKKPTNESAKTTAAKEAPAPELAAEGVGAIPENVPTARAPIAQEGTGGRTGVAPEPPSVEGVISGSAAEKWADQILGQDPRAKSRSGLDPLEEGKRLAAVAIKGAAVIERGIRDFTAWSAEMIKTYGPEIQKDLQRIYGMSNGFVEQSLKARAATPETAGESVKMRKSAERATTSPDVPEPVQERIQAAPESRYTQQSMQRVEEAVAGMTLEQKLAVPRESDLFTAARLDAVKDYFNAGDHATGYQVFVELEKAGTQMGQLINQFKLLRGQRPENVVQLVNEGLKKAGKDQLTKPQMEAVAAGADKAIKANEKLESAKTKWQREPTDANAAAADVALKDANTAALESQRVINRYKPANWPQMLKAFVQGNPLVPMSHIANTMGNIVGATMEGGARGMAVPLDMIRTMLTGGKRTIGFASPKASAEGLAKGAAEAPGILFRGASESVKGEHRAGLRPLKALQKLVQKVPDGPTVGGKVPVNERIRLAVEGTFGIAPEAMLRLLSAADRPAYQAARARLISEQVKLQKLSPEQARMAQNFPEMVFDRKTVQKIYDESADAVFQRESKTISYLQSLIREKGGDWGDLAFSIFVAPYKLTPWNLIVRTMKYNPLVALGETLVKGARKDARGAEMAAGRFVVGSALYTASYYLYQGGLIGASLDARGESTKERMLAGQILPPKHVNVSGMKRLRAGGDPSFRPGDETIDLERGGGAAGAAMIAMANLLRAQEKKPASGGSEFVANILRGSVLEQANFTIQQSFLKGVTGILEAIQNRNFGSYVNSVENMVLNVATPNTLSAISRATRKYVPDMRADTVKKEFENVMRLRFGVTGADDYLPLKRDLWGRPIPQTPPGRSALLYHLFDISKGKQINDDPVAAELYRLWRKTAGTEMIPSIPERAIVKDRKTYPLDARLYELYVEKVGAERRTVVDRLMDNPAYQSLTDEQKIKLLDKAYRLGMTIGKGSFWQQHNEELQARQPRTGFKNE